jgi:hypothetical protein
MPSRWALVSIDRIYRYCPEHRPDEIIPCLDTLVCDRVLQRPSMTMMTMMTTMPCRVREERVDCYGAVVVSVIWMTLSLSRGPQ